MKFALALGLFLTLSRASYALAPAPTPPTFTVALAPALAPADGQPSSAGRLYIVLAPAAQSRPIASMSNWFDPPQMLALNIEAITPTSPITITPATPGLVGFPVALDAIPAGDYRVQALLRTNLDACAPERGEGNLTSKPVSITLPPAPDAAPIALTLDNTTKPREFRETERIKLFEMVSPSLSAFHNREVKIRAGIKLPKNWKDEPGTHAPTVYFITGFGGDHQSVRGVNSADPWADEHILWIVPDPTCLTGHSVFADSACNGPRGRALMEELIPAVEARFHGAEEASRRYITGISSGGWSSLWLQVTYPDQFASCWSHCPDPVDFHHFQRIDIYADHANMYTDAAGSRIPLARNGDDVMLWYRDFVAMESALGPGGQIGSFEAVFSPAMDAPEAQQRLPGGYRTPRPLFDRETGAIDPVTAKAWEKYDLKLVLERGWKDLGPKLAGKLHIYAGAADNFYLDAAARTLGESLKALGSDAEVAIIPGMPHTIHADGWKAMIQAIKNAAPKEPAAAPVPPSAP